MKNWIDVKKELPKESEKVLVSDNDGTIFLANLLDKSFYFYPVSDSFENSKLDNITHWQSLPFSPYCAQYFLQNIFEIEWPVRIANILSVYDFKVIGELCCLTEPEMLRFRQLGKKGLNYIKSVLEERELVLGMDFSHIKGLEDLREKTLHKIAITAQKNPHRFNLWTRY